MPDSPRFPASRLLAWRLAEVELHHCDLGIGYGHDRWSAVFAAMELDEPMRSQRTERLSYVQPESVRDRSMTRNIAPYLSPAGPFPAAGSADREPERANPAKPRPQLTALRLP